MAVDTEYLDDLMKSIEPLVYPEGEPKNSEEDGEEVFGEEEKYVDEYEKEIDSIPEKPSSKDEAEAATEPAAAEEKTEDSTEKAHEMPSVDEELEIDLSMSEEEIDALLNSAKEIPKEEVASGGEDVTDILSLFGDDENISDIKDILDKEDKNIAVDSDALKEPEITMPGDDDEVEPAAGEEGKKKKEKKAKKSKKDKSDKASEEAEGTGKKKKGFFASLFSALTEEVDDETVAIPESSETGITDENAKILSELDAEEDSKKKKKKKKKKGKDSKEASDAEGSEKDIREKSDGDDSGDDSKKGKKKKAKKEKKPKKEKAEDLQEKPAKKLPKKMVRNTFILCFSILAAIIILSIFLGDHITKKQARYAYDNQEYEVAYSDLYGMKLNEEDEMIFKKSQTILLLNRKADSYDNYMRLGMKAEALNALVEGYKIAPEVLTTAEELGVLDQVMAAYSRIMKGFEYFGLSVDDVSKLAGIESLVEYNKEIRAITSSQGSLSDIQIEPEESNAPQLQDVLQEELDYLPDGAENNLD